MPNTVLKKVINERVTTERYYGKDGLVYLDIDYTPHGNLRNHPLVPHIHRWYKDNISGEMIRKKQEEFV